MGMIWDGINSKWKQFVGEAKKLWGKLTNDERLKVNGGREIPGGKIQQKQGVARANANQQISEQAEKLQV